MKKVFLNIISRFIFEKMISRRVVIKLGLFLLLFLMGCRGSIESIPSPLTPTITTPPPTGSPSPSMLEEDPFVAERLALVKMTIEARGVKDQDVIRAMRSVPRHEFVPPQYQEYSYEDHPLPIGFGQTISQPYIVAWMTELLELKPGEKVLEIGTGSGYQAAVLAELGYVEVYSIEIIPQLAESAKERLERLGYEVFVKQGDGYYGWEEYAPFDAIIVTAAPDHLPPPLVEQLVNGGRLVIPIGPPGGYQTLWKFVKTDGDVKAYNLGGVAFVPFTGEGVKQAPSTP